MKHYISILLTILLTSCQMKTAAPGLEEALSQAGDNRGELLRVLQHYEESGDSLKLRAAEFLIGNMADKGYLTGRAIDEWVLPYHVGMEIPETSPVLQECQKIGQWCPNF